MDQKQILGMVDHTLLAQRLGTSRLVKILK